jgi:antitoxin component YwqK of YwqJK toxin-antitoxin module
MTPVVGLRVRIVMHKTSFTRIVLVGLTLVMLSQRSVFGQNAPEHFERDSGKIELDSEMRARVGETGKPITGVLIFRYAFTGKIESTMEYKNGYRDGVSHRFDRDGHETDSLEFKQGKAYGACVDFYPNGKKKTEITYVNDVWSGKYSEWYDTGEKSVSGEFLDGKKQGTWRSFAKNGEILEVVIYEGGLLSGMIINRGDVERTATYFLEKYGPLPRHVDVASAKDGDVPKH